MSNKNDFPETGYTPENLHHLRKVYGLTQSDIAKIMGTTLRSVQSWEASLTAKTHSGMPHRKWVELLKNLESK